VMVKDNKMDLVKLIQALTVNPRDIMDFDNDLLAEGSDAELTIFDPHKKWVFSKDDIQSRSSNSPYIGVSMAGRVKYTIVKEHITKIS